MNDFACRTHGAAGLLVLTASAVWAEPAEVTGAKAERDAVTENIIVEGKRERSTVVLDEPVAAGSRLNIDARDLPASVAVISHELIELRGARTATEAIESAVGMTAGTSVGSIPNYATRGFAGNDVTIMRDGIRQNTASQSSRPLDSFLFERIEVLKGPASLLYGEGAIGGAINYVSKMPGDELEAETMGAIGSWDSYRFGFGLGGPTGLDGLSFRVDASHARSDGYVEDSGFEYTGAAAALRYAFENEAAVTLQSSYLKDSVKSYYGTPVVYDNVIDQNGVTPATPRRANTAIDRLVNARIDERTRRLNYNNLDNFAKADNSFTRLIVETPLNDAWSLRNEAYAATQHLDWRNTESTVWNPAARLVERTSFFLIYRNDLQLGNRLDLTWTSTLAGRPNQLVAGGLYDHNEQLRNSGQPGVPPSPTPANAPLVGFDRGYGPPVDTQRTADILTETAAIYVEDVYDVLDRVKLIGGLRYEQIDVRRRSYLGVPTFTKSYDPFTGRVGVVFEASADVNLYASYSRAAQPVQQLVSLTLAQNDFSLQKGEQYEIGVKASFGDATDLTLALFDIEKSDLLTTAIIDGVRVNSQIGAQVSQGAELAGAFSPPGDWRIDAHTAWTWKAEYEAFAEHVGNAFLDRAGNTPPNVPEWVAGVFATRRWNAWRFTAGARYVGERQANNNNGIQLDAYTTVDAGVSYLWPNAEITLRGRNLTDERYVEWASGGGLMMRFADPRSAEVGFKYSF